MALGLHLAIVAAVRRAGLEPRAGRRLVLLAGAFLGLALLSGPRHDYVADLEIWGEVMAGRDPWWLLPGKGYPLHAYGPLFNALAPLAWLNPMAPKLLFAFVYLLIVVRLAAPRGLPRSSSLLLIWNPLPWLEVAYFGHFDVLVAAACLTAVERRRCDRDAASGAWLASGVLLKYLPVVILPFLAVEGRRIRWRLVLTFAGVVAAGMGLSLSIWGPSTLRPLTFAAMRGSNLLSIFRFLRGPYAPLGGLNLDPLAPAILAAGGLAVFAWCRLRGVEPATGACLGVSTTLLLYQVGFVQYQIVPLVMIAALLARDPGRIAHDRFLGVALGLYYGWLAAFDLFYAAIGGVIDPAGPYGWVEDVVGLPNFALGVLLLTALGRRGGEI